MYVSCVYFNLQSKNKLQFFKVCEDKLQLLKVCEDSFRNFTAVFYVDFRSDLCYDAVVITQVLYSPCHSLLDCFDLASQIGI